MEEKKAFGSIINRWSEGYYFQIIDFSVTFSPSAT